MLALIICVIGVIIYFAARGNAKVAEVGRISFFVGLFFVVALYGGKALF